MRLRWIHKIETSSFCNFECPYCPNPYGLGYGKGNMTLETFERVCWWASILNPTGQPDFESYVHLHGIGEPLLNKHIVEFVRMLSRIVPCGFSTNGALLTEEKVDALEDAGIAYLCVSSHDIPTFWRAMDAIGVGQKRTRRFKVFSQETFDDDFAGQVKNAPKQGVVAEYHCAHIESGGGHILWSGDIVNCCVDAQGYPVLGSVYDDEIRSIDVDLIPLCRNCRSGKFAIENACESFSETLSRQEREAVLWRDVERRTRLRNVGLRRSESDKTESSSFPVMKRVLAEIAAD